MQHNTNDVGKRVTQYAAGILTELLYTAILAVIALAISILVLGWS